LDISWGVSASAAGAAGSAGFQLLAWTPTPVVCARRRRLSSASRAAGLRRPLALQQSPVRARRRMRRGCASGGSCGRAGRGPRPLHPRKRCRAGRALRGCRSARTRTRRRWRADGRLFRHAGCAKGALSSSGGVCWSLHRGARMKSDKVLTCGKSKLQCRERACMNHASTNRMFPPYTSKRLNCSITQGFLMHGCFCC